LFVKKIIVFNINILITTKNSVMNKT